MKSENKKNEDKTIVIMTNTKNIFEIKITEPKLGEDDDMEIL